MANLVRLTLIGGLLLIVESWANANLRCYVGQISNSSHDLQLIKCNEDNTLKWSSAKSKRKKMDDIYSELQSITPGGTKNYTYSCITFIHDAHDANNTQTRREFYCDNHKKCNATNVTKKVKGGTIHCCNDAGCNTPTQFCYTGLIAKHNTSMKSGSCDSAYCMSAKYYRYSGTIIEQHETTYSCDKENVCQHYKVNECTNVTSEDGGIKEICCCQSSSCNRPSYVIDGRSPISPLPNKSLHAGLSHQDLIYIVGVILAVVLVVLVSGALTVVIRRCKQQRDQHVRYIYSQLTADLSEDMEDDDAYLIVA